MNLALLSAASAMPTLLTLAYLVLMGWVIFAAAAEKVAR